METFAEELLCLYPAHLLQIRHFILNNPKMDCSIIADYISKNYGINLYKYEIHRLYVYWTTGTLKPFDRTERVLGHTV